MRGLFGLLVCAGCAVDVADNVVEQEVDSTNGKSLNGSLLNGTLLNGGNLNGTTLAGVEMIGTSAAGTPIAAATSGGPPLTGGAVVGSTWRARTAIGIDVTLRIDGAQQGATPNTDLWFYNVSYQPR